MFLLPIKMFNGVCLPRLFLSVLSITVFSPTTALQLPRLSPGLHTEKIPEQASLGDVYSPEPDQSQHSPIAPSDQTITSISEIISSSPLLSFHRSLCSIESTSNNENNVGNYLVSYLRDHGFGVLRQPVPPEDPSSPSPGGPRFNVFAWPLTGQSPKASTPELPDNDDLGSFQPRVILTSHIDTVPPYIPYTANYDHPSRDQDQDHPINRSAIFLHGRGTVDAKACVAAQTHAVMDLLHSMASRGDKGVLPVALLFVVSEETLGVGMKTFSGSDLHRHLAGLEPDAEAGRDVEKNALRGRSGYSTLIFGEPTESRLCAGHKGLFAFRIVAYGRAAHSGYPWLGVDANLMLLPIVERVGRLGQLEVKEGGLARSDKYGNSTVNLGYIRGGVAINVVSARAEVKGAVRLAGGEVADGKKVVRQAVEQVGKEAGVDVWVKPEGEADNDLPEERIGLELQFFGPGYSPVDLDTDVQDEEGKGGFGEPITVNYGTDVPNLKVLGQGVRRYLYGPGSILVAHGPREGLSVGDLEGSVQGYRVLIEEALERE